MNDLLLFAVVLSLFGIFKMKKWVVFNVTFFGTLKNDCVINTREIFGFLPLTNNSFTIEFFIIDHISNHIIEDY